MPFHQLQAEQIQRFRDAWKAAGHQREPRVSVSRSIFPIVNDLDRAYFGRESGEPGPGRPPRRRRRPVRQDVRRGARPAGRGARRGRGDRGRRHPAADGPQPARRRLQRPPARQRGAPRRAGARLALNAVRHACCFARGRGVAGRHRQCHGIGTGRLVARPGRRRHSPAERVGAAGRCRGHTSRRGRDRTDRRDPCRAGGCGQGRRGAAGRVGAARRQGRRQRDHR